MSGGPHALAILGMTPVEWEAVRLSLLVSLTAVLLGLPPALLCAWALARRNFPGKLLLNGVLHLPLVLPPVVIGYVLLVLLGRQGVVGKALYQAFGLTLAFTWKGAAVASAVMAFPLMVRSLRLALESVDRRLEQAARTLGAGPVRTFCTITLPLIAPGLITGTFLGFARSLGEFGATITFVSNIPGETRTLPLALYNATQSANGDGPALRLTIIAVIIATLALLGSEILAKRAARLVGLS